MTLLSEQVVQIGLLYNVALNDVVHACSVLPIWRLFNIDLSLFANMICSYQLPSETVVCKWGHLGCHFVQYNNYYFNIAFKKWLS